MSFLFSPAFATDGTSSTVAVAATTPEEVPYDLSAEKMMKDNLLILGLLFFIFYFILIRPQQKRVKLHTEMMKSLQKGSKVITNGGLIGTIVKFEGDSVVVLEIAQSVRVRVAKSAISEVTDHKNTSESANDN